MEHRHILTEDIVITYIVLLTYPGSQGQTATGAFHTLFCRTYSTDKGSDIMELASGMMD
jgi:hypothetical protein